MYFKNFIRRSSFGATLIGYSIGFFLLDFPLMGIVTTSRIGFLLFLLGFFSLMKNGKIKKLHRKSFVFIIPLLMLSSTYLISSLFHQTNLDQFLIWVFIFLIGVLLPRYLQDPEVYSRIVHSAASFSFITISVLVLFSIYKFGLFPFSGILRSSVNEIGPGLSRIVNGVVFGNIIIGLNFLINKGRKSRNIFLFIFVLSTWFILGTQSRQGLLGVFFLFLGASVHIYKYTRHKRKYSFFFLCILLFLGGKVFNSTIIQDEFVGRTFTQLEEGEGSTVTRMKIYTDGWESFVDNMLFGIGPGSFTQSFGLDAHSGYLLTIVESGFMGLLSLLFLFFITIQHINRRWKRGDVFFFCCLVLIVFVTPLFNSIINSPMFWTVLLLLFHYKERSNLPLNRTSV